VNVAGSFGLSPSPDIPMALDEMIYAVTSGALADADLRIGDVSGSFMAASDLYDGRAISTMTLTGSTGSFHKNEMRVCNDGLAALLLGAAEVASGAARAVIVCSWSKLSDASRDSIVPLALEPALHRSLHFHPDAVFALRESAEHKRPATVLPSKIVSRDVANALIVTENGSSRRRRGSVLGVGAATGPYLRPGDPVLAPVASAARAALASAGRGFEELRSVRVADLQAIDDVDIAAALGVAESVVLRQQERQADLGYAAGLNGVHEAMTVGDPGLCLVVSAGGLGLENSYAVLVDVA
jgi:hypothetical protein